MTLRANRIKHIKFGSGSLTSPAGTSIAGALDVYSRSPINGVIQRVIFEGGNYTATGSLWIKESGTHYEPPIYFFQSGAAQSFGVADPGDYYPVRIAASLKTSWIGSGTLDMSFQPAIKGIVHVAGSGLGTGKSGLGLTIEYI